MATRSLIKQGNTQNILPELKGEKKHKMKKCPLLPGSTAVAKRVVNTPPKKREKLGKQMLKV